MANFVFVLLLIFSFGYGSLLSGGVAGTIASCITNPLEVVKTQLQSSLTSQSAHGGLENFHGHPLKIAKKIMQTDGVKGFFKGLKPTLVGIIPAKSVYFYAYEKSKRALSPYLPEGGVGNSMVSGLMAGVAGNTLTNPIWLVKTRMQLIADSSAGQLVYTRYSDVISHIAREEGLGGFYKGIGASYWGCTEGMIQFVLYEQIKSRILARNNAHRIRNGLEESDKLPKAVYFFSAATAKGIASMATYPHEVARTRLREQARNGVFKYRGMWQTMGVIAREEGRSGLYAGMGVHLAKVIPNSAIMFLTYEVVNTWLSTFTISD
jgi:solute carrier family 25 protein 33/36